MNNLAPQSVWLFFVRSLISFFWLFLVLFYFSSYFVYMAMSLSDSSPVLDSVTIVGVGILVVVFLSYAWAKLSYKYYFYELTDIAFRKEYGVISKRYVSIPYDRIQNVDIYRSFFARVLGLSDLIIQTAGISGAAVSEGRLPGLLPEVAEQLRDELIQRSRRNVSQAQGV